MPIPIPRIPVPTGLIKISGQALRRTSRGIGGPKRVLKNIAKEIMKKIMPDLSERWRNADYEFFRERMRELEQDIDALCECLCEYEEVLNQSATEYEITQQTVKDKAIALRSPARR